MNFKIETNNLDISNYPTIEKHLEDMARKGWLIKKIIVGSLFIYKKIIPEELDFSVTPFEIETTFTKKSKAELQEFQSVCESVGWNYATKSLDFHIYFKEKGSDSIDIQTDEEEEFKTLELIGNKYIKSYYIIIPLFSYISWYMLDGLFTTVNGMKDGLAQITAPLILVTILFSIVHLINLSKFLKTNKKNIELGKDLEFSGSRFYFYRFIFILRYIIIVFFIIYLVLNFILFRNRFLLIVLLAILLGMIVGEFYRIFVKPSKIKLKNKKIGFYLTIIAGTIISTSLLMSGIGSRSNNIDNLNLQEYKILIIDDLEEGALEEDRNIRQDISILVPRSYRYYSYSRDHGSIVTEYSKASTEYLAKILVNKYKKQEEDILKNWNLMNLVISFNEGEYELGLLQSGFTPEDFEKLKDKEITEAENAANNIIITRSIVEDKENLWNQNEFYYLNYEKTKVVLRKGKEVFYLQGKDFSDIEVIKMVKEKLWLD